MRYTKLWIALACVVVGSFAVLGYWGRELYRKAPPVPGQVVVDDGRVIFTAQQIKDGQNVWQSMGGQEVGSVWGHGAYVAPDWSADWLHRESTWLLDHWATKDHGGKYEAIPAEAQASLRERLKKELRTNRYDPQTGRLTISADRAAAVMAVGEHYAALFSDDPQLKELRAAYAIPAESIKTAERREQLNAFFFWASWACATNRPGEAITYSNNWPHEPLIGNTPSSSIVLWSMASVILLLAGVGAMVWHMAASRRHDEDADHVIPEGNPLLGLKLTPSMRATLKYFWVVALLFVAQVGLGGITAHYGVEGDGFFGIPLDRWLPYAVARTWHTQLGIFWIATAWLATGLFMAPAISGHEPKFQRAGVNFLFVCLLIIVAGSMAGQWFGVQQKLGLVGNFWFGHQGYEYVDLGRFWQIFLFVGLFVNCRICHASVGDVETPDRMRIPPPPSRR